MPKLAANGCPMCHSIGYVQPNVVVYTDLLPFLAMGDAPETTPVIRKIANLRAIRPDLPTHPGGQRCETIPSGRAARSSSGGASSSAGSPRATEQ